MMLNIAFCFLIASPRRMCDADLKWKDVEELVTYGVKDCMRLDLADTPLFIADNALLGGPYSSGLQAKESKEKVSAYSACQC